MLCSRAVVSGVVNDEANEALATATHTVANRRNLACVTCRTLCHDWGADGGRTETNAHPADRGKPVLLRNTAG
jgi:hypothetical protein